MSTADLLGPSLLSRLRDRDPEILDAVVRQHGRPLYRAARGLGFREAEAEDLIQDVFITFFSSLDRFEGRAQLRTWLFGILYNKTLERRRKRNQEERHDPIDEHFDSQFDQQGSWSSPPLDLYRFMESREIGEAITRCLDALPVAQRTAFVLKEIEDIKTTEICAVLGVSTTNMGVLLHRARIRLRQCLEDSGWTAGP